MKKIEETNFILIIALFFIILSNILIIKTIINDNTNI